MVQVRDELPDDVESLKALLLAARAENARLTARNERLDHIIAVLRRARFGRSSERIDDDQMNLALEDVETAFAAEDAKAEHDSEMARRDAASRRRANRGHLPAHLPREEIVIEPESKACPCCGGALHIIGEDVSERLDRIPARLRVIVTRRPKYACRTCTDGILQAPAPNWLIEGGLPTEALVADVLVSKYADHTPLYRQAQILAREGIMIDRSTLAHWVGFAAHELEPLHDRLVSHLKASPKLFADETRCPVLDPGRGRTKTGYLWAIARDDRPWGGTDPPAVAYFYAPGRGAEHAVRHLATSPASAACCKLMATQPMTRSATRNAMAGRSRSRSAGRTSAGASTRSRRAATRRSRRRRWRASARCTRSRPRSAAVLRTNAKPSGSRVRDRSSTRCGPGSRSS